MEGSHVSMRFPFSFPWIVFGLIVLCAREAVFQFAIPAGGQES
jgi:hypothetical protein